MKLELVTKKCVSRVELQKDEKHCLGMTITDGTRDEAGPVIKKVKLNSPAGRSFAICEGDVILSFNGHSMVGTKSKEIIRMIKESGNSVDFKLQHDIKQISVSEFCQVRKQQRTLVLHKRESSFGFILRKKDLIDFLEEDYPIISNIKKGSHVHRHGLIQEGDRLLKIDDVSLSCLPLPDIARLLQTKNKAEFTYQYDVGIRDFAEYGRKVDLDIEVPNADLGVYLSAGSENSGLVFIEKIRLGSMAERCGLFSEGDIILSIDEIETRFLTISKASMLLQNYKKCRKISFIPHKRKKAPCDAETLIDKNGTGTDAAGSCDTPNCGTNHVGTLGNPKVRPPSEEKINLQKLCFNDQIISINSVQNIAQVIKTLKEIQLQLKVQKNSSSDSDYCIFCDGSQQWTKLCLSCLAKVNLACAQSIGVLQDTVSLLVPHSLGDLKRKFEANMEGKIDDKVSTGELIYILEEILPNVFPEESKLKEQFKAVAKEITNANSSCFICDFEVKFVWITIKNILLLLSVDSNRLDVKALINKLLYSLLKTDLSCETLSDSKRNDCFSLQYENPLYASSQYFTADTKLSSSDACSTQTNMDTDSVEKMILDQSNLSTNQIKNQKDYLKIIHIESPSASDESDSENDLCESDMGAKSLVENVRFTTKGSNFAASPVSFRVDDTFSNRHRKIYEDEMPSQTPVKNWRSLESILKLTDGTRDRPGVSRSPNKGTATNRTGMDQNVAGSSSDYARLLANQNPSVTGTHASDFNDGSTPSSFTNSTRSESQHHSRKSRTDTMKVEMINSGKGFGLVLGLRFPAARSLFAPFIQSVQPGSPSQKSGLLKAGDRVLAVNHRSTLGLTPKGLEALKKRTFSADSILLEIEFDVAEVAISFGTFDVVLNKILKVGLIFEDIRRGYPMVVSGIMKGSGAHRCGQLFPRDKITFLRCIRNEEFDPVSCSYSKEESVLITVQRDRIEGFREKPAKRSPSYFNPCFSHKDSVPRRGPDFIVKSSTIHVVEGTDALVLDQEVTLFRDPVHGDFGFLVGENPENGRAYVKDVRPDGPASKSGVIKYLDRIVQVNRISVDKNVGNSGISLLSQANRSVDLLIRRLYHENSSSV